MNKPIHQYKRFWLLLLLASYFLVSYFYAPQIISQQIITQLSKQLDMQTEMKSVSFNPLNFNISIKDLKISDANQETWFYSQQTGINFDPLNLLWNEWKFSDFYLIQPEITIHTDEAGRILIPMLPEFPESTEDKKLDFSIDQIQLIQGYMHILADHIKKDFKLDFKNIALNLDKLTLADADTHFKVKIVTENDESIALTGHYNHSQKLINSEIQLIDFKATTLNQILPDDFNIDIQTGVIQANGYIDWSLSKKPQLKFSNIEVQAFQSQYQNSVSTVNLHANIQQVNIDTEAQTVKINRIESAQGDWQVNWPLTLPINQNQNPHKEASNQAVQTTVVDSSNTWQVIIDHFRTTDWSVELIDHEVIANLLFKIKSLEILHVNNLNQESAIESLVDFVDQGTLNINSVFSTSPLTATAEISLNKLSLQPFTHWTSAMSGFTFTQGQLSAEQTLTLNNEHYELTGALSIKDAIIFDQYTHPVANWDVLLVGATTVSSLNKTITFDHISLNQANGKIPVSSDQSITTPNSSSTDPEHKDWIIKIGTIKAQEANKK